MFCTKISSFFLCFKISIKISKFSINTSMPLPPHFKIRTEAFYFSKSYEQLSAYVIASFFIKQKKDKVIYQTPLSFSLISILRL